MPTEDAEDNREYCKAYYGRLKADPSKYLALKAKKAEQQRLRRTKAKLGPVETAPAPVTSPVETPVTSPVTSSVITPKRVADRDEVRRLAQERAAIMEFDGGMTRANAESAALREIVKDYGDKVLSIPELFRPVKDKKPNTGDTNDT